jgi:predicted site-specific integrase-resolvase
MLKTTAAAQRLGAAPVTVRLWCRIGLLPGAIKVGESPRETWLIPESALEGFQRPKRGPRKSK